MLKRIPRQPRTHHGRAPIDHTARDALYVNGRAVVHDGEAWTWQATGEPLDFDQCEQFGLDGTGRQY